ncbi:MAG: multidrug efflux SMR transporter [Rhizobiaceae bacterium]|nr:multidrug efflux SMR transporter [Rhizobiaceae bacterium]
MAWVFLGLAGLFEVVWATSMKMSAGFTKIGPTAITIVAMIVSFTFLSMSLKALPLGTAYAIWTGIGAAGAFVIGIMFMGEALTLGRAVSILLLVSGIIGLKLSTSV